eukprot:TRINITY_DN26761_c0_g1_i1.p1 TRINITY_DN26761_c0_g1~~TRINITY_DN26761_c0_g1_i1.p1  ORF type:complete len:650 (+),score=173.76 TRINITY_DN26761_c0_g1_i1:288-1952(+)
MRQVRADLERVEAVEKETDLFRFFQTRDLPSQLEAGSAAKRGRTGKKRGRGRGAAATAAEKAAAAGEPELASLKALTRLFASQEFRELIAEITQCGELTDRVDLSSQVYPSGSHLLCHDDVIGTRKVSFIYYLTDPEEDWTPEEGGALELYPQEQGAPVGTPAAAPTKTLLPLADSLALFIVEPGVSFHAVSEVRSSRARVSIQGWLHAPSLEATKSFEQRGCATLQQILQHKAAASVPPSLGAAGDAAAEVGEEMPLSKDDFEFLKRWLAPEYLDASQLSVVAERFADASYAVLAGFLRADLFEELQKALEEADQRSCGSDQALPAFDAGACDGWNLVGPPHLRRFLRYDGAAEDAGATVSPERRLGSRLRQLSAELFGSAAFRRWLAACTRLAPERSSRLDVRRFRPGLDYTVAVREAGASAEEEAELDATLTLVGSSVPNDTELWQGEEVGGFESYLAADEDEETAEAQEVYRGADPDEGPLVNLPATANALCLIARDSKTLRFVKYLSRDAPSSRVDVAASYPVQLPDVDDSNEEEGDPEARGSTDAVAA